MQRFPTAFLSIIACAAIAGCGPDKANNPVAPVASSAQISSSLQRSDANDDFQGEDDDSDSPYTLALIGDTPYGAIKLAEFPGLVADQR